MPKIKNGVDSCKEIGPVFIYEERLLVLFFLLGEDEPQGTCIDQIVMRDETPFDLLAGDFDVVDIDGFGRGTLTLDDQRLVFVVARVEV